MSDYLVKLAARHGQEQPPVAPRLPSLFESVQMDVLPALPIAHDDFHIVREEIVELPPTPHPQVVRSSDTPPTRVETRIEPMNSDTALLPRKQQLDIPQPTVRDDISLQPFKPSWRPRTALPEAAERHQVEEIQDEPLKPRQRSRSILPERTKGIITPASKEEPRADTTRRRPDTTIPDVEAASVVTAGRIAPATTTRPMETPKRLHNIEPQQSERIQDIEPSALVPVQTRVIERQDREIVHESAREIMGSTLQLSNALEPRLPAQPECPVEAPRPVEPVIQVTIGRIEVRVGPPQPEEKPKTVRKPQTIGLDEYLRRRDRKGRP